MVKLTLTTFDVTAYARYRLTRYEELIVYRAVWSMTNCTAFPHRFVLEDKRASLFFVALEAFLSLAQQAGTQQHFPSCSSHVASVHIVAVGAEHSAFRYGMVVLEHEFSLNIKVTAIARCFSICQDDLTLVSRIFNVKAAGTVTRLAPLYLTRFCIFFCYVDRYACMVGELEIVGLCCMTILSSTAFRTNVLCAWN
jgi:hypothetical protein